MMHDNVDSVINTSSNTYVVMPYLTRRALAATALGHVRTCLMRDFLQIGKESSCIVGRKRLHLNIQAIF